MLKKLKWDDLYEYSKNKQEIRTWSYKWDPDRKKYVTQPNVCYIGRVEYHKGTNQIRPFYYLGEAQKLVVQDGGWVPIPDERYVVGITHYNFDHRMVCSED
jgi:hypothetical protein